MATKAKPRTADNGHLPGLKMPVKVMRLRFDEDGYPGFECDRRINLPIGTNRQLADAADGSEEATYRGLLLQVFPWWNFADEDGEPIPHTVEGFDLIPDDLLVAMFRRGAEALREAVMPAPLGTASSDVPSGSELVS